MDEIVFMKAAGNVFVPATTEDAELASRYKLGRGVRMKVTQVSEHNAKFHQKLIMLFTFCYEHFADGLTRGIEYRGHTVTPSFDRFRKDLTILAGHYESTFDIRGNVRLEARSLAYANLSDVEKEKLYSSVIDAALRHVFDGNMAEDALRQTVEKLMDFDR